jgi:CHAT domain-containing protein/Tfp pilus assembly protein PilF
LALAAPGAEPPSSSSTPLTPGAVVEREASAGGGALFSAVLPSGSVYLFTVEARGIHLVLDARTPAGSSLAAVDSPLDRWAVESLVLRPAVAASYAFEVRSDQRGVGPGRFLVRLDTLASSTAAERERIAALEAATRAGTLFRDAPAGRLEAVVAAWQEARDHFRSAADRPGEAEAVAALAAVSHRMGRQRQAADLYREAAALWRELGRPEREVQAWNDLGLTLWELSDLDAAGEALGRGLEIAHRIGLAYSLADLRNNQCLVLHARGGVRAALDCYREAQALYHGLGETKDEGTVLNNLGFAYYGLGEPQPAEESYRQALALRRSAGDRAGEAQARNNLAVLFRSLGEIDAALQAYGEAREILSTLDDRRQEAATLNNLGVAYSTLGESARARIYLTRALELRRAVEDRRGEIATLNNLGWLASRSGAASEAIALHRQALAVAAATSDARNEAISRSDLGEVLSAAGRAAEALPELASALALQRQTGDRAGEARTLRRQGEALAGAGRGGEAAPLFEQALAAARAAGARADEALIVAAQARLRRDAGDLDAAAADVAAAIATLESLRARLGNPELRAAFLGSRVDVYELRVDILMRLAAARPGQGYDRAAFEASEQARARALLDLLLESGARVAAGAAPDLAARQRDLERRLALKEDRRQSLLGRAKGDPAESAALALESEQLRAQLDALAGEIRRRNPRYAALTQPTAAGLPEIQALLDSGTLLLEYSLGRERSYLWAVDAGELRSFVLPGREEIERAARSFHEALGAPAAGAGATARERLGRELSRILLGPVADRLGERRLAIVADGALDYIPFDVLPDPRRTGRPEPLLARHEVVSLPSASVLAAERKELARRPPARNLAIVLADPVFRAEDPRVAHGALAPAAGSTPAVAGVAAGRRGEAGPASTVPTRLRFSRQEALAIAALAPPGAVATRLDFAADRDFVVAGGLRDFRYVHFATHGVFDAARPELSGLALSLVDAAGAPREGFVRLRDVYALDLQADLVVLSGCETALGREIRGEGLLGLTRGFLYAGAPRVVASLWWIDDRATAALMTAFYRALWTEKLRPAAALRQARLALARQPRFRDPAYWGAFVLQGDWR